MTIRAGTHVTNVEDGGTERELVSAHAHGSLHTEDLGVVQRGLVEVLKGLGDEEEGEEEHVDTLADTLVLLGGDVTLELGLIVGSETDVGLVLLEIGVGAGRVEMLHIALLAVSGKVGDL